ncbi:MAG: hypothetical protein RJB31_1678, partial [Bacteroidota bacterium]
MRTVLVSFILLISLSLVGQQQKLIVQASGNQLFLEHKVVPKENWYSVGRIYFISPKEIASFNKLSMDKGLAIGQLLKIPLKQENFSQSIAHENNGGKIVHIVQPKEGLYKLANLYNVDKELLKKMNKLSSDQLNVGTNLVSPAKPTSETTKTEKVAEKDLVKEEKAKQPAHPSETAAPAPQTSAKSIQTAAPVKAEEETVVPAKPVAANSASNSSPALKAEKSYFSTLYEQQSKEGKQQKLENSVYGVFKSTSGWQDGKYYVLMNN